MALLKVIEIMGDSSKSFDDAIETAVSDASATVKGIRTAWVKDQSVTIKKGKISGYRVNLKISFEVER